MIQSIQIKNFKSVVDLSLELGSFNVLIGENGCGKSNILEAMAFGAAASADKLDYEFLGSRGIRATNPEFMFSAFSNGGRKKVINIGVKTEQLYYSLDLGNDSRNSKKWINYFRDTFQKKAKIVLRKAYNETDATKRKKILEEVTSDEIHDKFIELSQLHKDVDVVKLIDNISYNLANDAIFNEEVSNYILFALEQSSLRKFEETNQIYPLGIRGEGLFQYLKELASNKKNKKIIDEIKQNMLLLDWYEDFDLGDNLLSNEFSLKIKDKYLNEHLQYFDQRSTNEGFLYLLFYSTLFISKDTPSFFAIDNIDASFNPKLCVQLIKSLATLAKKHKKQVIVTTHNPAVLDGLNLKDDNQRLFVISRNSEGHTRAERINYNENRTMRLSEIWTKGFIGGLPENF